MENKMFLFLHFAHFNSKGWHSQKQSDWIGLTSNTLLKERDPFSFDSEKEESVHFTVQGRKLLITKNVETMERRNSSGKVNCFYDLEK